MEGQVVQLRLYGFRSESRFLLLHISSTLVRLSHPFTCHSI
jgi:hypothetical protein